MEITKTRQLAASLGVELDLDTTVEEVWFLNLIRRSRSNPGAGAVVLRALNALADENCARVWLRAEDIRKGHISKLARKANSGKLARFYAGFGYELTDSNRMVRLPRSAWPKQNAPAMKPGRQICFRSSVDRAPA